jgi:copper chaperone CopZ
MDNQNTSASAQKNLSIEEPNDEASSQAKHESDLNWNPSCDDASEARITAMRVEGMDCINCAARVQGALTALDGVVSADVDWQQGLAIVDYIPTKTNVDALVRAVAGASDDRGHPSAGSGQALGDGRHNYRAQIIGSKENV